MSKKTYIVVREHALARPMYYQGMTHSFGRGSEAAWADLKKYAWVFASRGDASIIAKKWAGRVVEVK